MRTRFSTSLLLALVVSGCGRETTPSDVKLVGVGYNPDEIGPKPTAYGGVVEYNWLDFAGGGLSLGFAGLLSFDEVNNEMGFYPPYALIYGFSYIFDVKLDGAASAGMVQPPPPAMDACYTVVEPTGPLGSFNTTDVGAEMAFVGEDGSVFALERTPAEYPPDPQDMFVYYSTIEGWRPNAAQAYLPGSTNAIADMEPYVVRPANFAFGETVSLRFPGGVATPHAPVGSLPVPSASIGDPAVTLPRRTEGIRMAWNGPRYFMEDDMLMVAQGEHATCMKYHWPDDQLPEDAAACVPSPDYTGQGGQFYTGPWDTEDGKVTFQWTVPEGEGSADEAVVLTVRFLGAVDRHDDEYLVRHMTNPANPDQPALGRDTVPCEEGEWVFDPSYVDPLYLESAGSAYNVDEAPLVPALQGDPMHTLADVTCRLADDGEFELTQDLLASALDLAQARGAEGAVFFFSRVTTTDAAVPDVKDAYDQRRPISPVLVSARTVEIGRFIYEADAISVTGEE